MKITALFLLIGCLDHAVRTETDAESGATNTTAPFADKIVNAGSGAPTSSTNASARNASSGAAKTTSSGSENNSGSGAVKTNVSTSLNDSFSRAPIATTFTAGSGSGSAEESSVTSRKTSDFELTTMTIRTSPERDTKPPPSPQPDFHEGTLTSLLSMQDDADVNEAELMQSTVAVESKNVEMLVESNSIKTTEVGLMPETSRHTQDLPLEQKSGITKGISTNPLHDLPFISKIESERDVKEQSSAHPMQVKPSVTKTEPKEFPRQTPKAFDFEYEREIGRSGGISSHSQDLTHINTKNEFIEGSEVELMEEQGLPSAVTHPINEIAEYPPIHVGWQPPHILNDPNGESNHTQDSPYEDFHTTLERAALRTFSALESSCREGHTCDDTVWDFIEDRLCSYCFAGSICSCVDECHEAETCCLDKVLWDAVWKWRPPRVSEGCCSPRFSAHDADSSDERASNETDSMNQRFFKMKDACPASWSGDVEIARRCTAATSDGGGGGTSDSQPTDDNRDDDGDDPLSRQWPVWSPVTNVTYRNVHCARCHGQDAAKLRRWDISVNCRDGTHLRNDGFDSFWDLVNEVKNKRRNCYLEFNPPRGIKAEICEPIFFLTSSGCDTNKFTDAVFSRTCETFFSNDSTTTTTTINNNNNSGNDKHQPRYVIHSITSNHNISIYASYLFCSVCHWATQTTHWECTYPSGQDIPFPFVLVISFQALMSLRTDPAHLGDSTTMNRGPCSCAFGEIYDTYESRCRKLHCSWLRRLNQQHSCVPSVEEFAGQAYHLAFQLVPTSNVSFGSSVLLDHIGFLRETASEILLAFKRQTGLTSDDRFDMFRVTARTKQINHTENLRDGDLPSREGPSRAVIVESFDVKIKVMIAKEVCFEQLEDRLVASVSSSSWNFSVDGIQDARSFQAIPLYAGTDRREPVEKREEEDPDEEIEDTAIPLGEPFGWSFHEPPPTVKHVSSDGEYEIYFIDIRSELLNSFAGPKEIREYRPERYYPVQRTLLCSKVSFVLDTACVADSEEEGGKGPSSNTTGARSASVNKVTEEGVSDPNAFSGTGSWWKRSATDNNQDQNDSKKVAQSVEKANGEVIVSLDLQTGWLHHHPSGRSVHFRYVDYLADGQVHVCAEQLFGTSFASDNPWEREKKARAPLVLEKHFSPLMIYVSLACQSLSTVCLFLAFFTYCVFPELRTLPGKNNMGLMASLFVAMLLFEVGVARVELPVVCTILGVAIHFSLLSGFTWMVLCSVHMHHVFTRLRASRHYHSDHDTRLFVKYVAMSLLVPAAIVTLTLVGNWATHREDCVLDLGYGRGICYVSNAWSLILASVLPICVAVVINLVLFVFTLRSLRSTDRDILRTSRKHRKQLVVYVRLSTLTGINWLAGLLAAPVDSLIVWYLFIVLCGLQGVYIFVAFVCNNRVLALYRALLCCAPSKERSVVTTEATRHPTSACDNDAEARAVSCEK